MASEDRSWAVGMTQTDFEKEWLTRHPFSDIIPDVDFFIKYQPVYNGITGVTPEDYVIDGPAPPAREVKPDIIEEYKHKCHPGCGRSFKVKIALFNHKKKCKAHLNSKI